MKYIWNQIKLGLLWIYTTFHILMIRISIGLYKAEVETLKADPNVLNEKNNQNQWHIHKYFCLFRICCCHRGHFLLNKHGGPHEQGQHRNAGGRFHVGYFKGEPKEATRSGQIVYPEHKRGVPQLYGSPQNSEKSKKNRGF